MESAFSNHTARPRRLGSPVAALAVLLCVIGPAHAIASSEDWTVAVGRAEVVEGDELRAWRSALTEALEQAVERAAEQLVVGLVDDPRYLASRGSLVSVDAGYVLRYEVVGSICEDGVCVVEVRAKVARPQLSARLADLGLLTPDGGEEVAARWVSLDVEGVGGYHDLLRLQDFLREKVEDVRAVRQTRVEAGRASLELMTTLSTQRLATLLNARSGAEVPLMVTRVDSEGLGIRLNYP